MDADIPMDDAALVDAHEEPPPTDSEQLPTADVVKKWTRKDLLDFTLIKDILEDPEDVTIFTHAKISGRAFLRDGDVRHYWSQECQLPLGPSGDLAELAQRIKNMGKEKSQGNAFHLGSVEPANTFTVQSPLTPWDGKLRPPSVVERSTEEEFMGIGRSARLWEITSVTEAKRDERIKSKNSRVMCDPKAIAN